MHNIMRLYRDGGVRKEKELNIDFLNCLSPEGPGRYLWLMKKSELEDERNSNVPKGVAFPRRRACLAILCLEGCRHHTPSQRQFALSASIWCETSNNLAQQCVMTPNLVRVEVSLR